MTVNIVNPLDFVRNLVYYKNRIQNMVFLFIFSAIIIVI